MKKFISGFLAGILIMCMLPVGAAIQQYTLHKTNMKVTIEGKEYKNTDYPILAYKSETYIPLGEVSKALGIDSTIDLKKKTINIKETQTSKVDSTTINTEANGPRNQIVLKLGETYTNGDFSITLKEIKNTTIDKTGKVRLKELIYEIKNPIKGVVTIPHIVDNKDKVGFYNIEGDLYSIRYIKNIYYPKPYIQINASSQINVTWDIDLLEDMY